MECVLQASDPRIDRLDGLACCCACKAVSLADVRRCKPSSSSSDSMAVRVKGPMVSCAVAVLILRTFDCLKVGGSPPLVE